MLGEAGSSASASARDRPSKLDPYMEFITETLQRFPTLTAATAVRHGQGARLPGAPDHFRHASRSSVRVARVRRIFASAPCLASRRQIDWAHFGKLTIGRAERPLMAFVLVLSYSRYAFVRFYLNASLPNLIRGQSKRSVRSGVGPKSCSTTT